MPPVSVARYTGPFRPQVEGSKIRTGSSSGYPVSEALITPGSGESFPPNIQGSGDNSTCLLNILPKSFVLQKSDPISLNWASGLIPLARLHMRPLKTTFSFVRSDKSVYTTVSISPFSPCHPTQEMAGPFSHIWNPYPVFPSGVHDFHGRLYPRLGFPDFGYLDLFRPQAPHQHFGAQGVNSGPPSLGFSIKSQPSHSEVQDHPGGQSDTNSPLVAITTIVSTSTMSVCGPPLLLSIPPGPTVTTQIIPSMEALKQHY